MRRGARWLMAVAAAMVAPLGCSHIDHRWRLPTYSAAGAGAIKRLLVVGAADDSWAPGLAATLATTATDFVKLRRNYIVLPPPAAAASDPASAGCAAACQGPTEGVLVLRALDAAHAQDFVALTLRAELWACRGQRPVWQAEGHHRLHPGDARLAALTASYRADLGVAAAGWAALAFVLGQELLDDLPDPTLTDAEVEEKIEAS